MIPAIQREALGVLTELCDLSSDDIRLGQLVAWLGDLGKDQLGLRLADLEDEELLVVMHRHREELLARLPEAEQKRYHLRSSALPVPESPAIPEMGPAADVPR
jgi:thiamine monophosphate kinase